MSKNAFLIEGYGLTVRFGGSIVLEGVDIVVPQGQVVTLIGPNGAGKTTLIRVLLGLAVVDSGEIRRQSGLRIGYVPQRLYVDSTLPLTVRRFLSLARGRRRVESVLEEVAIARLVDRPMQHISGGEMQRVLLARALLGSPNLLVLDEPVQGVDIGGQGEFYTLISRLRDDHGCGVLLVSHDLHLVMAATDYVICLNRHVCCAGAPAAVSRQPKYMALFGGGGRSLALYQHHHDHWHGLDGSVQAPLESTPPPLPRSEDGSIHG